MLYNFDNAVQQPFVVICEGVTDVWRIGLEAVALFGKTLSPTQAQLICAHWKTVIILLDGDALDAAREIAARLSGVSSKLIVPLPADTDPADFDRGPLREFVFWTAQDKGILLAGEPAHARLGGG
jgi:DNA primase